MGFRNNKAKIFKITCPICGKPSEQIKGMPIPCRSCHRSLQELEEYRKRLLTETNPAKIKRMQEEISKLNKKIHRQF